MDKNAHSGVLPWQVGRRRRRLEKGFQGFVSVVRQPGKKMKLERQCLFPEMGLWHTLKSSNERSAEDTSTHLPDVMSSSYYGHLMYLLLLFLLNTELTSGLKVLMCLSPMKQKDLKEISQMK